MPIPTPTTADLAVADDLVAYPGAPFSASLVKSATEAVRGECGWHIAPVLTETLTLDCAGGPMLRIPTLELAAVTAVRDVSGDSPVALDGWRKSKSGLLERPAGWPYGFEVIEVDITHGYATCPADLLPAIAAVARAVSMDVAVSQQGTGPYSVTYTNLSTLGAWLDRVSASTIARYKLPPLA